MRENNKSTFTSNTKIDSQEILSLKERDDLVGTWKLVTYSIIDEKGSERILYSDAVGTLIYTSGGYMSVIITREKSKILSLQDVIAYSGKYHIEGDRVFHHVAISCAPKAIGTVQVRRFAFLRGGG